MLENLTPKLLRDFSWITMRNLMITAFISKHCSIMVERDMYFNKNAVIEIGDVVFKEENKESMTELIFRTLITLITITHQHLKPLTQTYLKMFPKQRPFLWLLHRPPTFPNHTEILSPDFSSMIQTYMDKKGRGIQPLVLALTKRPSLLMMMMNLR